MTECSISYTEDLAREVSRLAAVVQARQSSHVIFFVITLSHVLLLKSILLLFS